LKGLNFLLKDLLDKVGIGVPEILLPAPDTDFYKWSVVACDQFTSQPEYWDEVEKIVGVAPSTFRITLPEVFLDDNDCETRISEINTKMNEYMDNKVLESKGRGFVLVERTTHESVRCGLVVALDLEHYDYSVGSQSQIRATEGTVLDRIPPRKKIRQHATLETPHIMVLINDKEDRVIGPLFSKLEKFKPLYDTKLMQGGGKIKGWLIDDEPEIENVAQAISSLSETEQMLYAVGDGNHSLASAKSFWNDLKATLGDDWESHPARYALVELVNLYDKGLEFEPIHRVVFDCDYIDLLYKFELFVKEHGGLFEIKYFVGAAANKKMRAQWNKISHITKGQMFAFVTAKVSGIVLFDLTNFTMTVVALQAFLDQYMKEIPETRIDYVHGTRIVFGFGEYRG